MNPLARARHVVARRPWLYWLAVLVLAATAGWVAARAASAVDDARADWGTARQVVVAVDDIAPGDALDGHTAVRSRPLPALPRRTLHELPAGARARQWVTAGEVVVATDVVATAGPQALIPAGWSALAVAEPVPSGAAVGDTVTAVGGGVVLATGGVVVGLAGTALLVAVPDADAPRVALAASNGELSLLLEP
jgi:hypothetical protein